MNESVGPLMLSDAMMPFLPGTGRGTGKAGGGAGAGFDASEASRCLSLGIQTCPCPSTSLRLVPLPVPGRSMDIAAAPSPHQLNRPLVSAFSTSSFDSRNSGPNLSRCFSSPALILSMPSRSAQNIGPPR